MLTSLQGRNTKILWFFFFLPTKTLLKPFRFLLTFSQSYKCTSTKESWILYWNKKFFSYADSQHSHTGRHSAPLSNKNILSPASFENMPMTFMNFGNSLSIFFTKIVLIQCEIKLFVIKKNSQKFEAEDRKFAKWLRSL